MHGERLRVGSRALARTRRAATLPATQLASATTNFARPTEARRARVGCSRRLPLRARDEIEVRAAGLNFRDVLRLDITRWHRPSAVLRRWCSGGRESVTACGLPTQ